MVHALRGVQKFWEILQQANQAQAEPPCSKHTQYRKHESEQLPGPKQQNKAPKQSKSLRRRRSTTNGPSSRRNNDSTAPTAIGPCTFNSNRSSISSPPTDRATDPSTASSPASGLLHLSLSVPPRSRNAPSKPPRWMAMWPKSPKSLGRNTRAYWPAQTHLGQCNGFAESFLQFLVSSALFFGRRRVCCGDVRHPGIVGAWSDHRFVGAFV